MVSLSHHHIVHIDGRIIQQCKSKLWDPFTTLLLSYPIDGIERKIEIRFGKRFINTGAQILIDNQWTGGDRWMTYPEQADTQYAQGCLRFLVHTGWINYGVPYGIGMTLVHNLVRTQEQAIPMLLLQFIFYSLLFGTAMGYVGWRGIRAIAEQKQAFLNGA